MLAPAWQVLYLKTADMVNLGMSEKVGLEDRILMQTASIEVNRLICLDASIAAGYHIEEIVQVRRGGTAQSGAEGIAYTHRGYTGECSRGCGKSLGRQDGCGEDLEWQGARQRGVARA